MNLVWTQLRINLWPALPCFACLVFSHNQFTYKLEKEWLAPILVWNEFWACCLKQQQMWQWISVDVTFVCFVTVLHCPGSLFARFNRLESTSWIQSLMELLNRSTSLSLSICSIFNNFVLLWCLSSGNSRPRSHLLIEEHLLRGIWPFEFGTLLLLLSFHFLVRELAIAFDCCVLVDPLSISLVFFSGWVAKCFSSILERLCEITIYWLSAIPIWGAN